MRYLLLCVGLFAFALFSSSASAQRGSDASEVLFEIQYESESPSERGGNMATIVINGLDRSGPALTSVNFSTSGRASRRGTIRLTRNEDGSYTGKGEVPAHTRIETMTWSWGESAMTLKVGSLEEGERDADVVTPDQPSARKVKVKVRLRCCPVRVIVVVSGIQAPAKVEGMR